MFLVVLLNLKLTFSFNLYSFLFHECGPPFSPCWGPGPISGLFLLVFLFGEAEFVFASALALWIRVLRFGHGEVGLNQPSTCLGMTRPPYGLVFPKGFDVH